MWNFKKLDLYLSADATNMDAFLFLSRIPRFNLAPSIIVGLITCYCDKLDLYLGFI
jgi:hypothetical protein